MKLFFKAKESKPVGHKESIEKLRGTLELLEKREAFLQAKCEKEVTDAKKFLQAKNKRAAMMCLKRKKTYETQVDKIAGARMTIETQVNAIEGATVTMITLDAMKMGAQTMKALHKNMTPEQVDDTMEEIQEQMSLANELNEAISQPLGTEVIDEDELEAELELLEQENIDSQLLDLAPTPAKLPAVPTAPLRAPSSKVSVSVDEDAELRALEESMAI